MVARAHKTLIWERTRHTLRLRHALREFFPAALVAFPDLTGPDALDELVREGVALFVQRPGLVPGLRELTPGGDSAGNSRPRPASSMVSPSIPTAPTMTPSRSSDDHAPHLAAGPVAAPDLSPDREVRRPCHGHPLPRALTACWAHQSHRRRLSVPGLSLPPRLISCP